MPEWKQECYRYSAEDGFGKTALLNALHWVLKLTSDVSQPGVITECLLPTDKPNELEASVEIHYIHEETDYILKDQLPTLNASTILEKLLLI